MVEELNEKNFKEKIVSGKVLVDLYAPWCGPCRMLGPVIEELAGEVKSYTFYKLNVDEASSVAQEYGVMSIPTLLIFEDGKLKDTVVGLRSKSELKSMLGE